MRKSIDRHGMSCRAFPLFLLSAGYCLVPLVLAQVSPPAAPGAASEVAYAPSDAAIANPERGFYNQVDCSHGVMSQAQLRNYRSAAMQSLAMCAFVMADAVDAPLSQARLDLLQSQFDAARAAGVKLVLRFSYNYSNNAVDAPLPVMLHHMDQLKPALERNQDVIAVLQAGFIGSWGEWGQSRNYGGGSLSAQQWSDRGIILDRLLATLPPGRMLQLRTPDFAYRLVGARAVTAAIAFDGSARARVGQHNDCFLASANDRGTYRDSATDMPWLQAQTLYTPMGGETCGLSPPRTDCPTAVAEMARFHWSYINAGHDASVLNGWRSQGCYGGIQQKLGYRFVLKDGSYSDSARPGGSLALRIRLANEGYAAPFNSRPVQLVLRNDASGALYRLDLPADPRKWLPGTAISIDQVVTLPPGMERGSYSLLLALPDAAPSLAGRAEYAIQLANADTWEADTGLNRLKHRVSIAP